MADSLPLLTLNDNQFELTANGIDYSDEIDPRQIFLSQSQLETLDRFNNAINNITFNLDEDKTETESENSVPSIDCKYYTIDDSKSQKFNSNKHFSIMHLNISSIEYHIEEFQIILKLLKHQFDFICISETKLRDKLKPKTDINIEGYNPPIGMPTHASKGGVLMYIRTGINCKPREDLNMQTKIIRIILRRRNQSKRQK